MKLLFTFLFSIGIQFCLISQNWAPINSTEQFNYRLGDADVVTHVLKIDSVQVNDQDSVMYLNRVIAPCDTCCTLSEDVENGSFWLNGNFSILGHEVTVNSDGNWIFSSPNEEFTIYPNATLNESWMFNNDTEAIITESNYTQVLGEMDSTKVISLSDNSQIILSKNHGIIAFPSTAENSFNLVGIEGRNIGQISPSFSDVFDFEVGDLFQFKTTNRRYNVVNDQFTVFNTYGSEQRIVNSVAQFDDSIVVSYTTILNDTTFNVILNEYSYQITEGVRNEVYKKSEYDDLIKCPRSLFRKTSTFELNTYTLPYSAGFNVSETGRLILHFGGFDFITESTPKTFHSGIEDISFYGCDNFQSSQLDHLLLVGNKELLHNMSQMNVSNQTYSRGSHFAFSEQLGYISRYYFRRSSNEFNSYSKSLGYYMTAFQKANGESEGELIPEDVLLSTNKIESQVDFKVFPNPAQNFIHISGDQNLNFISVKSILGKEVLINKATGKVTSIEIDQLASGTYIIEIGSEKGQRFTQRFIKE